MMSIPDDMRKKYVGRRAQDLASLSLALESSDFDPFFRVGHQLRGNAETFGYDLLADLGERMEAASTSRDRSEAEQCLKVLRQWLDEQP